MGKRNLIIAQFRLGKIPNHNSEIENSTTAPAMASAPISTQTPIEKFDALLSSSEFLFIVSYRGHWCPFCRAYLTTLTSLLPEMRKSTGYEGEAIVDESNELVGYLREKFGWEVAITERKGYEHGMAQPGVLVLKKDGEVLEKWAIVPSLMNIGGAKDRPELPQIWENIQAKLKGEKQVHGAYKKISAIGVFKSAIFG